MLDTSSLTLLQKAELAKQLIEEVVREAKTREFADRSETHRRVAGLFRVFGDEHMVSHAGLPLDYLSDIQAKEGFV